MRNIGCEKYEGSSISLLTGLSNEFVNFTAETFDGPPKYRILNYQRMGLSHEYQWVTVGQYNNGELQVSESHLITTTYHTL